MSLENHENISVGTRLASMLIDHILMTIIVTLFATPIMISDFSEAFSSEHVSLKLLDEPLGYIAVFDFSFYFCKDILNGRSIAKRILKLQVVDDQTGQVGSPLKYFLRNISCVLWPIEVIVSMINPNRRIGDRIAGTKLVKFDPLLKQPQIDIQKTILTIVMAYCFTLLLMHYVLKV